MEPLVPKKQRAHYERFVRAMFTGRGGSLDRVVANATRADRGRARRAMADHGIDPRALPRDLTPRQWAALWRRLGE